ncbi:MAG: hypothetical protein WD275_07985 [Rhodothermales bacterium]
MPQTLLAFCAVMLAAFFAFQQQRSVVDTRMKMVQNEVETAATGVAVDRLEEIGVMAYDEATKSGGKIFSSASLTAKGIFTVDAPPIDDVDDFDGSYVERFRVYSGDTLWYGVETGIQYADEAQPDQEIVDPFLKTKFKKATVRVYSLNVTEIDTISLSQSYSCGSKCDWP